MKKGMLNVYGIVFSGVLVSVISLFIAMFIWQVYQDEILTPINDVIQNEMTGQVTGTTLNNIQNTTNYSLAFDFGFDLLFLLAMLYLLYEVYSFALTSPAISKGKFVFLLFGNFLISGFILFYFTDIVVWFATNFILNYFNLSMPFFEYFINNIGWLLFFLMNTALIANQLQNFINEESFQK